MSKKWATPMSNYCPSPSIRLTVPGVTRSPVIMRQRAVLGIRTSFVISSIAATKNQVASRAGTGLHSSPTREAQESESIQSDLSCKFRQRSHSGSKALYFTRSRYIHIADEVFSFTGCAPWGVRAHLELLNL